ncbi:hypothetical protein [Jatrophihabitans sp.]|uniref:hypothetical protein n=1 Tax=Jatrophihabitans sp. TaxID=1932789 RepID=UPI002CBCB61B|nr:hypothetical protein [Jatrophihabitans sp.]
MVSQAAVASEPGQTAAPVNPRRLLDWLAVVLVVVQAGLLYRFMSVGYWFLDDFENLELAQTSPLSSDYLNLTVFGHPQPGNRLVNWLLIRAFGLNYQVAAGLVAVGIGLTAFTVYRILRNLFPPSPLHLVFASMVGATALWLPTGQWWAGGSGVTACSLASALSCASLVRCYLSERDGRRMLWGLLAGLWMLAGLMFYERTLFGGLFGALFLPAAVSPSLRPREVLRVVRQAWIGYLSLAAAAAGFLWYYLTGSFVRKQPGYTGGEVVHYLWVAWSHSLVPGLFGGPLNSNPLGPESTAGTPLWWLVVTEVALGLIALLGLRRLGWRSLRGWLILLPIFLVAQYSIATARLASHGPRIGNEFRYLSDMLPLAVLALAVVLLRPGPDPTRPDSAPADGRPLHAPRGRLGGSWRGMNRRHLLLGGVALLVTWTVFLTSAVPISRRWSTAPGRDYMANLRRGIEAADARGPWSLYTTMAPNTVSLTTYGRYSSTPYLARLVSGHEISTDDLRRPMYLVDPAGQLVPARLDIRARAELSCTTDRQQVVAPVRPALDKGFWTVVLRYRVAKLSLLRFAVFDGGRYVEATGSFRGFPVTGSGELTFMTRATAIQTLRLDARQAGVCLTEVRIGRPLPAS